MKTLRSIVLLGAVVVAGCDGGADDTSNTSVDTDQTAETTPTIQEAESPEVAFAEFSAAMKRDDWQSAITMITPESQEMMVMGLVMQAAFMTMEDEARGKELEELFKKHGLDDASLDEVGGDEMDLASISDQLPEFVGELSAWIKTNEDESEGGFPEMGELSDVKIDGDSATAMADTPMGKQPIEFRRLAGAWKVHLDSGPPPAPSLDDMDLDFENNGDGEIGQMSVGEKSSGLNHAYAFRSQFFEDPCIVLVLSAIKVSEEQRADLEKQIEEDPESVIFFPEGPNVTLTMTAEGELLSVFAWIDNSSLSTNRGPAVEFEIDGDQLSGRAGMAAEELNDEELQFHATFDTAIEF